MKISKGLAAALSAFVICLSFMSYGRAPGMDSKDGGRDSLVVLLSSKSAQMMDVEGNRYRKVIGPARFLHNGTFLLCDTALWNVETQIIEAWGHVSILQEETVLTSDRLTYIIDEDLAQFRGSVVQLTDKDRNTLRTRHLDYNTADSVAVFQNGGAMRDKDGQIIESRSGTYDSKAKTFLFSEDVNMFTDSIFVKTSSLRYESDRDFATFGSATDVWKEDNMLSSGQGWYDRRSEQFFFTDRVHIMSADQEGWCDSLYFFRNTSDVEMLGNAQLTDTTRNVFGLAGRIEYIDSLSKITMTRQPAVISQTNENGAVDTVYLGARKLVYHTLRMCDVDNMAVVQAQQRRSGLQVDPVGTFRRQAAEAAAKAAEEAAKEDPNYRPPVGKQDKKGAQPSSGTGTGGNPAPAADSLGTAAVSDSLAAAAPDTSKVGFLLALGQVKVFRKDMQVSCDSLVYSDLDSLAQLFREPIIWQDGVRQYTADSVYVSVSNQAMDKAMLMSDAFITIKEDTTHFDQIKGTEMMAYFDEQGSLKRFDVLGGASALFYIEENDALATVNKTDSKMLSAIFSNGELQKIYYFEGVKNDGYPIVSMSDEERSLKGFRWYPEKRPADRYAVTPLSLRPGERARYSARPKASFRQTDIYFPGYMKGIRRQIHVRDSLRQVRGSGRSVPVADEPKSLSAAVDSVSLSDIVPDSLGVSSPDIVPDIVPDSLGVSLPEAAVPAGTAADTTVAPVPDLPDSLASKPDIKSDAVSGLPAVPDSAVSVTVPAKAGKQNEAKELKAQKKAEYEKKKAEDEKRKAEARQKKQDIMEQKWAKQAQRDMDKAKAKEEKRLAKERKRKRKALAAAERLAEKEARIIEKYRLRYEQRKTARQSK